jgi:hypothetical protein
LPRNADWALINETVENICVSYGLRVALKASLSKSSGSTHWHLKDGDVIGTLEVTLWPEEHRAWLSVQDGRVGPWIEERVALLQDSFQHKFRIHTAS